MALSALHTWVSGEILYAADLNAEFSHIYAGGIGLVSPITSSFDLDGNTLVMDADGDSSLKVSTNNRLDITLQGVLLFKFDGTVASPVNGFTVTASATGVAPSIAATGNDTDIDVSLVPKGAGVVSSSTTGTGILARLTSTDAGASEGPDLDLYRDSATPAANDVLGGIQFNGRDSGAAKQLYGRIKATATTVTAASEASLVTISAFAAGAETDALAIGGTGVLFNSAGIFRGMISGLTLSNNAGDATNDIDIAVGIAAAQATPWGLMALTGALTKQLDAAWAVGSAAGMRASGAVIADTTYFIFLIRRPDTGVVDVAADVSATGANVTANTNAAYTQMRRIGAIVRSGGAIRAFKQFGDIFAWDVPISDVNTTNPGTSAVTRTLTVPIGIVVQAWFSNVESNVASDRDVLWTALDQTDTTPSTTLFSLRVAGAATVAIGVELYVKTNTSGQVRYRADASGAGDITRVSTHGWVDRRGRDD